MTARSRSPSHALAALAALALVSRAPDARASAATPLDRHPHPTIPWALTQLLPSPELGFGPGPGASARFGVRWQLTPVLYSFGMYRKLSPWRFFVVEPLTRTSGSLETYVVPEYLDVGTTAEERWMVRLGLRVTLPIAERGEYLSVSFGAGPWLRRNGIGASWELGAYTLFGVLGLQLTVSPEMRDAQYVITMRVRYF